MSAPTQLPLFSSERHKLEAQDNMQYSTGSYTPVIIVLTMIALLSVASCILGRICLTRWNNHVACDLEKGAEMVKANTTAPKNKEARGSKIKPKMTTAHRCELHGNRNISIMPEQSASVKLKKQGLDWCELHGAYLSKNHNEVEFSDDDGE